MNWDRDNQYAHKTSRATYKFVEHARDREVAGPDVFTILRNVSTGETTVWPYMQDPSVHFKVVGESDEEDRAEFIEKFITKWKELYHFYSEERLEQLANHLFDEEYDPFWATPEDMALETFDGVFDR